MSPVTTAGDLAGLFLLATALVITALLASARTLARRAAAGDSAVPAQAGEPAPTSDEDGVASPAALELEEPVGASHQQYAVP
jgi:hypothetical protein